MSAPEIPTSVATLEALSQDVRAARERWEAWRAEHPTASVPVAEVMGSLFGSLTPEQIGAAVANAPRELAEFISNREGPITPGGDPSAFA